MRTILPSHNYRNCTFLEVVCRLSGYSTAYCTLRTASPVRLSLRLPPTPNEHYSKANGQTFSCCSPHSLERFLLLTMQPQDLKHQSKETNRLRFCHSLNSLFHYLLFGYAMVHRGASDFDMGCRRKDTMTNGDGVGGATALGSRFVGVRTSLD